MRIFFQHHFRVRQTNILQNLDGAFSRVGGRNVLVTHRHFNQLGLDGEAWIERRHRLLINHGDLGAAQLAQFLG